MKIFQEFLAKRRTKKFIILMSQTLAKDYGRSGEYTEGQVKTALKKLGYTQDLEEVAIAILCKEEIAKAFGMDEALIKKYRGYPREHNIGVGADGYSRGLGGNGVGGGDAGGGGD